MKSILCKVALLIITPQSFVGSNSATGVKIPDLPTCQVTQIILVVVCSP